VRYVPVNGLPSLHPLPAATLSMAEHHVVVELDEASGERLRLDFSPLQAVRIRTVDLFIPPEETPFDRRAVVEVVDSPWLADLSADLARADSRATFMEHSRHFLMPAGDAVIEVAAWGVEWTAAGGGGRYPEEKVDPGWP